MGRISYFYWNIIEMKIVADAHIPYLKEYFGHAGELVFMPGRAISSHDVKDADVLLVRSITHVDENLLSNSRVKFVGSVTAGADHLDTTWLDKAGISWCVATAFNAPPVADYVVSVIAALQTKHHLLEKKQGKIAVIGVGHVGRLVVERLQQLNYDIVMCDPLRAQYETDFFSTPLEKIADVDAVTLHVPLVKLGEHPTFHFINEDFLKRQKKDCVLINAARGAVVNSKALQHFGAHLHWCLDVWEHEPNINLSILEKTLIATPHIAGYSIQSKIRGVEMIYRAACEKNIIPHQTISPISMPTQQLLLTEKNLDWRQVVLSAFNPMSITDMMQNLILPVAEHGRLFDEMRHPFNYRSEFSFIELKGGELKKEDEVVLKMLGFK